MIGGIWVPSSPIDSPPPTRHMAPLVIKSGYTTDGCWRLPPGISHELPIALPLGIPRLTPYASIIVQTPSPCFVTETSITRLRRAMRTHPPRHHSIDPSNSPRYDQPMMVSSPSSSPSTTRLITSGPKRSSTKRRTCSRYAWRSSTAITPRNRATEPNVSGVLVLILWTGQQSTPFSLDLACDIPVQFTASSFP